MKPAGLFDKMQILDKYMYKQVIELFVLGIFVFASIIFASDTFISLIKQISSYGMAVNIAFMIVILNLPAVIVMTIPMSVLFASVMTVNKMCRQSEIIVLKACGAGIKRISRPVFIFAAAAALLTFAINETIVPAAMSQSKTLGLYALMQHNIPDGKRNFTIKELTGGSKLKRLFYVEKCEDKQFYNVSILDLSNDDTIQILEAKTGTSVIEGWQFNNASIYNISKKGKTLSTSWAEKTIADFGSDIQKQIMNGNDGSDLNIIKLLPYALGNKNINPETALKYKIKFWEKIALPITAFVFALAGIPLALTPPRAHKNRGLLFCIAVIFFYYIIRAFSINLAGVNLFSAAGINFSMPPMLAANLPNIIIGAAGYLIYKYKAEHN